MIHCMIRLINQGGNSHVNRNRTESKRNFLYPRKNGDRLKERGTSGCGPGDLDEEDEILKANAADVAKAKERGMAPGTCGPPGAEPQADRGNRGGHAPGRRSRGSGGRGDLHEEAPERTPDRPETGALRCYRNHLRGETERYGRCFCALL